uniref:Uncharacterized protein n=1 Tax=Anguilla anguilla TaxID=7936 RepID=A0A0E9WDR5_ANGAN
MLVLDTFKLVSASFLHFVHVCRFHFCTFFTDPDPDCVLYYDRGARNHFPKTSIIHLQ